ncbi:transposase [Frankia sp. AgB32]|uniref:transposase n=1 Tax=Frankia sp. AgB32 TaxID=631119 RepID=UPI0034D79F41
MPRRHRHRYPSALSDAQWGLIEPLLPPAASIGRREKHDRRDLVDALLYVVRNGCAWRALPSDYPLWQTVCYYFARWHDLGVTERVHDALPRPAPRPRRTCHRTDRGDHRCAVREGRRHCSGGQPRL